MLAAPRLMKALTVIGTAAMFMVGGGILTHGVPVLHHGIELAAAVVAGVQVVGGVLGALTPLALDVVVGILAGAVVLVAVTLVGRVRAAFAARARGA